ncbi:polyphosphate polymerase domain-containing protein [Naasia aerilata]|uniref:VTC domain-containing protein n=1 Tax=Naasia aerilata TaxID=1162966 RepID=A0ABM8GFM5_9MICO|nr:polyphosphate polymerase domain-containing protein [Naasia aerilata]BDZ47155.1 VTC domain-containing protein [Naasia aerilata]
MSTADRLLEMQPISLDDLNAVAALQTRVDRKYLVPRDDLDRVLRGLGDDCRVLDFGGSRSSAYESVYFDTPDLASYLSAARKRRRKFKIRTRAYLDTGACFLEVKTAGGRSLTIKDRLEYTMEDRDVLTAEGREYVNAVLGESGVADLTETPLAPTLITRYSRSTLYIPSSGARATIDVDLEWVVDDQRRLVLPELAVVESKSAGGASVVDKLLWRAGHRPVGISKYGVGLAALQPDLPSNKWRRVLKRHFLGPHETAAARDGARESRESLTSAA